MRRLLLIRHASTAATRAFAFPRDEPLDERARTAAALLAKVLPAGCEVLSSPAARCRETAGAAGLTPCLEPALAECDFGDWGGRTLADLASADEAGVADWMTNPDACPHGGESLTAFAARVAHWLDAQAEEERTAVAITHAGVVKAAIVHALAAPIRAFWQIDVAPLAITELHAHDRRWTLTRANVPTVGAAA